MRQRYLFGRVEQYSPTKAEQIGCVSRKNHPQSRFESLQAQPCRKTRGGQVEIALSELENCIPDVKGVEQVAEEALLVSVINRFLFAQTKTKRNIFILRYWFLYSIRDIADMYGERESKIKALLFRMRNELKKLLEKEDFYL